MTNTTLKFEINSLPKELRAEVANFIEFLKSKQDKKSKSKLKAREFGFAKGKISLSPDFDEPLDEFKEYM
jgi:outer membrane protein OmpA-like peptidoglycan-associated protein